MRQSNQRRPLFRPEKTAAKDIGTKAIDVGKAVANDAGKKLFEKASKKLSPPKSQVANVMVPPEEITKKVNEVIAKYVDTSAINLIKLINEWGVNRPNASNVIAIQNSNFFSSSIRNDCRYFKIYRYPKY